MATFANKTNQATVPALMNHQSFGAPVYRATPPVCLMWGWVQLIIKQLLTAIFPLCPLPRSGGLCFTQTQILWRLKNKESATLPRHARRWSSSSKERSWPSAAFRITKTAVNCKTLNRNTESKNIYRLVDAVWPEACRNLTLIFFWEQWFSHVFISDHDDELYRT